MGPASGITSISGTCPRPTWAAWHVASGPRASLVGELARLRPPGPPPPPPGGGRPPQRPPRQPLAPAARAQALAHPDEGGLRRQRQPMASADLGDPVQPVRLA